MGNDVWMDIKTRCPYCRGLLERPSTLSLPLRGVCTHCSKEYQFYYKPIAIKIPRAVAASQDKYIEDGDIERIADSTVGAITLLPEQISKGVVK